MLSGVTSGDVLTLRDLDVVRRGGAYRRTITSFHASFLRTKVKVVRFITALVYTRPLRFTA